MPFSLLCFPFFLFLFLFLFIYISSPVNTSDLLSMSYPFRIIPFSMLPFPSFPVLFLFLLVYSSSTLSISLTQTLTHVFIRLFVHSLFPSITHSLTNTNPPSLSLSLSVSVSVSFSLHLHRNIPQLENDVLVDKDASFHPASTSPVTASWAR